MSACTSAQRSARVLAGTCVAIGSSLASAATYLVTANPDATFTPASLTIHQGDAVRFRNAGGLHNVVADDGSFACGFNCNTNTAPSTRPWDYTIAFNRLGAFGYYCEQHGDLNQGMRGSISVIDQVFVDGFDEAPAP